MQAEMSQNPMKVWNEKMRLLEDCLDVLDKVDPGLSLQRGNNNFKALHTLIKYILGIALYEKHLCLVNLANLQFEIAAQGADCPPKSASLALLSSLNKASSALKESVACLQPEPSNSPAFQALMAAQEASLELNSYLEMVKHLAEE